MKTGNEESSRGRSLAGLVGLLVLVFVAAGVGGAGSAGAPALYAALDRPAWAPPAGVFAPVWTLLYLMMAISAWLIWRIPDPSGRQRAAFSLFGIQLAVNALWSWCFFAWQSWSLAFVNVVLLDLLLVATIWRFALLSRQAAFLLLPYLAWIGFATVLTWSCWQRNPLLLG